MGEELASARYRWMTERLRCIGAPEPLLSRTSAASDEELAHAALCKQIVSELGGQMPSRPTPRLAPLAPPHLSVTDSTLYEMVAFCCLTETLNATLLVRTLEHVENARIADALRTVLRDEVKHSQLGWAYLTWTSRQSSCAWIADHLPEMLRVALGSDENVAQDAREDGESSDIAFGLLSPTAHASIVRECLADVIQPGLSAHGLTLRLP